MSISSKISLVGEGKNGKPTKVAELAVPGATGDLNFA